MFLWGVPEVKKLLNTAFAPEFKVPLLHEAVMKVPPVEPKPTPEKALFAFNVLSATGTALLIAGVLAGLALGLRLGELGDALCAHLDARACLAARRSR